MSNNAEIQNELLAIKGKGDLLKPSAVVEWAAANPTSRLYKCFTWDDGEAARQYRIWQARHLISLNIITETGERKSISLSIDRAHGGGYRDIEDVSRDPAKRQVMLSDALAELERIQGRYESLRELARVFAEVDVVKAQQKRKTIRRAPAEVHAGA